METYAEIIRSEIASHDHFYQMQIQMELGDNYSRIGLNEQAIGYYSKGLNIALQFEDQKWIKQFTSLIYSLL